MQTSRQSEGQGQEQGLPCNCTFFTDAITEGSKECVLTSKQRGCTCGCSCWMEAPRKGTGEISRGTSACSAEVAASDSRCSKRPCTRLAPSKNTSEAGFPSTPAADCGAFFCSDTPKDFLSQSVHILLACISYLHKLIKCSWDGPLSTPFKRTGRKSGSDWCHKWCHALAADDSDGYPATSCRQGEHLGQILRDDFLSTS